MNIEQNNLTFQHNIPTEAFMKSALGIHKFDDAKILNNSVGIMISGHKSFYKRAIEISQNILEKNPSLKKIIENIISKTSKDNYQKEIQSFILENGKCIDVVI